MQATGKPDRSEASTDLALVGHPFASIGRGEDLRCAIRALEAAGLRFTVRDAYGGNPEHDPVLRQELAECIRPELSPRTNVFFLNGDEVEQALAHLGSSRRQGSYDIVYPQWELSIYPPEWARQLDLFDEIWAPSRFVLGALKDAVSKPVVHMPLPIEPRLEAFLPRRYFGLPESSYLFLFFFDFSSYIERKNPLAVLRAFEKACEECPEADTALVVKTARPWQSDVFERELRQLKGRIQASLQAERIILLDRVLPDYEIKNLMRACDCFVSLHRSEGFGRGMAEAMWLGKPVVATGYSGNLDFMTEDNSRLVPYTLIEVQEGQYPYAGGQVWAEPDVDQAAERMSELLKDGDSGRRLGQVASRHVRTHLSHRAFGLRFGTRLDEIHASTRRVT